VRPHYPTANLGGRWISRQPILAAGLGWRSRWNDGMNDHKSLNEDQREVVQKLAALPEEGRRAARRMIIVVFASFGICSLSGVGIVVYMVWAAPGLNRTVLIVWIGGTILVALVGITFVSVRFAKLLGLPLKAPRPPDPPPC